jgi:hypothetical protein
VTVATVAAAVTIVIIATIVIIVIIATIVYNHDSFVIIVECGFAENVFV